MNSLMSVLYHKIVIQYIYDLFGLMSGLYHKIVNQKKYIYISNHLFLLKVNEL
jgi:hypothetical protein